MGVDVLVDVTVGVGVGRLLGSACKSPNNTHSLLRNFITFAIELLFFKYLYSLLLFKTTPSDAERPTNPSESLIIFTSEPIGKYSSSSLGTTT